MPRIQTLPPAVTTKIAAGEVIERPASVVKELLENAVDAGSTRIDLEVEQGGIELIGVVDNGCGIVAEDLPLAFASHATSKLRDADDLFRIGTLGFRGEALASIGGVAQVLMQSRPADQPSGAELRCEGGEMAQIRPWNGSPGTRIEVRHLFYNTPVRRRFMRSPPTEMAHVSETFIRLAMSQLTVHWSLTNNGRTVYDIPASAGVLDRIGTFFGDAVSQRLYAVEARQGATVLKGYIADPQCDRGNAKGQYLFVNGRWVRDRSLGHAVQEAFRGLLMTGRYAVTFLFLELPADQVDVNVHPTKAEVRFRDPNAVHHLVLTTLRERLRKENLTARLIPTSTLGPPRPQSGLGSNVPISPPWTLSVPTSTPPLPFSDGPPPQLETPTSVSSPVALGDSPDKNERSTRPEASIPSPSGSTFSVAGAKVIQLYDTYLVVETQEGMLVIDQHALHERILFEQLTERLRAGSIEKQPLLIPEPIDLTSEQAARVLEQRQALAELGLEIEEFGGDTVLLRTCPALLGRGAPSAIFQVVVDHLMSQERLPNREILFSALLSLLACHSAVRAGDHLPPEEIAALLQQRHLADNTHHCPHGRPTALLFSRLDLERQFGRI
jgi:DNA mismatch repair protein MutL